MRPKALRLRIDGIWLRIALVHMVLAMLHNLDTLEKSLDTVGGGGVLGRRRHEEYPHSLDVGIRTELLCGFCRGGADAHLEGAQSVELHLLATSQVLLDNLFTTSFIISVFMIAEAIPNVRLCRVRPIV